jgi:stage II sporulation protein D
VNAALVLLSVASVAAQANPAGRLYRVGLTKAHALTVTADKPFTVVDGEGSAPVWKDAYRGSLTLVAEGGPEEEPRAVFRVQVAAFSSEAAAQEERARLEREFGVPAVVRYLPDRGSWRVRLGEATAREALQTLVERLRSAGRTGMWIAEEPQTASGVAIRLVDASFASQLTTATRVLVVPGPGGPLKLDGKPHRGILEVRVNEAGQLRAINWVELESYLRGVVPSELGPEVWPQIEALKAQAVAARTYAIANAGQFEDEGFDLCATPRCQAYGGIAAEHPLSDRAVAETAGEIATYGGKAIDALYTATCGGHTEDAKEIFPEQAAPYLVGVPCRAEAASLARSRRVVEGAAPSAVTTELGEDVTRDAWLLAVSGVLDAKTAHRPAKELSGSVPAGTLRSWTAALAKRAGRPEPQGEPLAPSTLGRAALAISRDLGWEARAQILVSSPDEEAFLRDPRTAALPDAERRALAYLAWQGAMRPDAQGRWVLDRAPSGATLAAALVRIGEAYDAFDLAEGSAASVDSRGVVLVRGRASSSVPLAPEPRLFTLAGSRALAVGALQLWPGDKIRYHKDASGRIDFLELRPTVKGLSDDRSAAVYVWEVRKTAAELTEAVERRVSVGTLQDLRVVRRGVSGRIVELEVVGSQGSTVVKGFDVRNLLDLRESLTVIELQRDPGGRIVSAVFAGKGWGHGVGLCQVGAYGMALRGADYKTILEHYYPGISLSRAPADPAAAGTR